MSHPDEPSYYEIALTNRQVATVFVVLLTCVAAAFFAGVWIGRRGAEPAPQAEIAESPAPAPGEEAPLRELRFFSENAPRPAPLEGVAETARPETTLLEDLEGSDPAAARPAPPPPAERPARAAPPPPAAAPEPAPAAGDHVVQVFSSTDEGQAKRLVRRLSGGGFPAFLSPVDVRGQTMYRVRVGPYRERAEAESVAERVKRTFKLDTWVTQFEQI